MLYGIHNGASVNPDAWVGKSFKRGKNVYYALECSRDDALLWNTYKGAQAAMYKLRNNLRKSDVEDEHAGDLLRVKRFMEGVK